MEGKSSPLEVWEALRFLRLCSWAVSAVCLLLALLLATGCSSLADLGSPSSSVSLGGGSSSNRGKIYMRDLLQRIELMTDPDWSITADDLQKLASGQWQTLDASKIDDVTALAAITSVEATQQQPPDSALKDLGQRWVTATAQYYSSVADLRAAFSQRSQESIQASLARVDASQALIASLRERCVADCTCMPAAPTSEYELSLDELIYLGRLKAADVALDYPLIMTQAAAEAGGQGSPSLSPSLPLELLPRLVRVCVAWTYGAAPTGRLQQIGAGWDTAMNYTRQVADLLQQIHTSDPDVMARLRVVLHLATTEIREVRTAMDSFGRTQRVLPSNSLVAARTPSLSGPRSPTLTSSAQGPVPTPITRRGESGICFPT